MFPKYPIFFINAWHVRHDADVDVRHDADVACDGCSASSYLCKFIKNVLEKGEHLLQNGILHSVFRFSQDCSSNKI